jgi:succinate-semialdehyde dehydrogenase/glutarate-semialdehyde dehydrogenase
MTDHALWFPLKHVIAGEWRAADRPEFSVCNPADGTTIAGLSTADGTLATEAIAAATAALPDWAATSPPQRGAVLGAIHDVLLANRDRLARWLTLEQGKVLPQALAEVDYAASFYRWFAEEARRLPGGAVAHPDPAKETHIHYAPVGVVGCVTPWNFPLAQAAKKLAAALAAGCTVVLKPAEETPLMGLATAWAAAEAGLPPGVLNVLCGDAPAIGVTLTGSADVRAISVTGSVATGRLLMRDASQHLQRVTLELGGNAPFIVLDDADLERTVADLIRLKFMVSGQVCVTANRVFVPRALASPFVERLTAAVAALRCGNGLDPDVDVGPLVNARQRERVVDLVDSAVGAGATATCGGQRLDNDALAAGWFYAPTVLTGVTDLMRVCQEEVFGPVIPVLTYDCLDDAVARANATPYGLAGYVYGADSDRALAVARRLEVGIAGVNDLRPLRAEVPFGGIKASGLGREGGREGLLEYLEPKVIGIAR